MTGKYPQSFLIVIYGKSKHEFVSVAQFWLVVRIHDRDSTHQLPGLINDSLKMIHLRYNPFSCHGCVFR
jgi:hypothetical protein